MDAATGAGLHFKYAFTMDLVNNRVNFFRDDSARLVTCRRRTEPIAIGSGACQTSFNCPDPFDYYGSTFLLKLVKRHGNKFQYLGQRSTPVSHQAQDSVLCLIVTKTGK